jgi:DNA repair protein RadC
LTAITDVTAAAPAALWWHWSAVLIATAEDAAALLRPFFDDVLEERVAVLHLDLERRVIGITNETASAWDGAELPVAAILGSVLRLGAAGIVVGRNRPGGEPGSGEDDGRSIRRLAEAAAAIGVRVVDHLVFTGGECRSYVALGLL